MTGRPTDLSRSACTKCGELLRPGDRFCAFCGSSIIGCERCGSPLGPLDRFCPRCGTSLGSPSASEVFAPPAAEPVVENPWARVVSRLRAATAGEFEILRELGRGGMAAVYLAHEVALNRKVAIKVMSPALLTGEGMVRRFRQEAVTVANMGHPHIITIHAVRQIEDLHFFVMKFVEGRSLEHIIRSAGPLPLPTVRGLMWMVGNALAYAHRRGVVHRDVKPANILLDDDGNAIVTDFGIAKLTLGDGGGPRTSGQTQTGVIVGTPTYMSPEQCLARPVSAASDQYSLGLVAYELLTGRPPFTGSPFVVMHAHTERPAPSIREQRPDCDPELDEAVMRMLAKEPAQRWPSVQHALAALRAAPLADADPARLELAGLSMPRPFRRSDEVLQTTPSPVPAGASGGGSRPADPRPYVAAIEIFSPPQVVEVGDAFTLTGSARNPSGDTMPGVRVRWTSSDERIASIDEARGLVQARAPGEVEITASASGIRNFVKVAVVPKRVAAINLSLPPGVVHVGDRVQLVATPEDKHHEGLSTAVHWASANEAIAVVGDDGVVSAKAPGQVLVWAEAQGVRGIARIEVTPAPVAALTLENAPVLLEVGESWELHATASAATGEELADRALRWTSSDPDVAEVINGRVVFAKSAGIARLTCSSEGKTASAELTVVDAVVARISIATPPKRVDLGLPLTLYADVFSERGARIEHPIVWRSDTPRTAAVGADGVVLPLKPGQVKIVASAGGIEEVARFEVNPAPEFILSAESLSATQSLELSEIRRLLEQKDPDGTFVGVAPVALPADAPAQSEGVLSDFDATANAGELPSDSSGELGLVETTPSAEDDSTAEDDSIADDDSQADDEPAYVGPVVAEAVEAELGGQAVDAAPVEGELGGAEREDAEREDAELVGAGVGMADGIEVDSSTTDLVGVTTPGSAGRFSRRQLALAGSAVVGLALVAWAIWPSSRQAGDRQLTTSSGALAVADRDTSAPGPDSVPTAVAAPDSATAATPTVSGAAQPDSIVVAVLKPIRAGDSTLLRGRIIGDTTGRPGVVVWTSSAPKVVRVNARTGRLVAVAEGAATITGRWGNATAKVPVRVLPPAPVAQAGKPEPLVLTELIATEIKSALREGDTIRLTAAALDQHGRSLLDRRVTWSAERPDIASVDVWGLVTAHRVGKTQIVATLEQHSVKVPVTVVPRPVAASDVATALRARADEFLAALTERNAERLTALYFPGGSGGGESEQDRKNLDWLIDKFRPEANLRVTRAQIRKPDVRDTEAVTELSLRLTWTQPSGKDRDTNANFRARFSKAADGWQLDGIRAVKNLE